MITIPIIGGTHHKTVPEDMQRILSKSQDVLSMWKSLTPIARNEWICWVTIVKKAETRTEHLKRMYEDIGKGKRRPCCWPGCPHHRPKAAKWYGKLK